MLVPAILYKIAIISEFQKKFYTEDMLFETGSLNNWAPDIVDTPDSNNQQFAIIDSNKKLVGYLDYYINWYTSCASQFDLMSFDKFITYHQTYFNQLKAYIKSLTNINDIIAIQYGIPLTGAYAENLKLYTEGFLPPTELIEDMTNYDMVLHDIDISSISFN